MNIEDSWNNEINGLIFAWSRTKASKISKKFEELYHKYQTTNDKQILKEILKLIIKLNKNFIKGKTEIIFDSLLKNDINISIYGGNV